MKTIPIFLFVALTLATTLFASDIQVDGIWYDFDNTNLTASVTYKGNSSYEYENEYTGSVVIPTSVSHNNKTYSVTTIGSYAFQYCSGLTSVTIPNSVTTIGVEAFNYCSGLTSITIPNSVTTIGEEAFSSCSGLTSVTIGNSVTSIGSRAFQYCSNLTSVTIPNSVTMVDDYAFLGCTSLTAPVYNANCFAYMPTSYKGAYTIPDGIKQIVGGAFYFCSGLSSITISNSVTTIGNNAFTMCKKLTLVTIPNSVTTIGNSAFSNCSGLTSVKIPDSVTQIGGGAFGGCGLTAPLYNSNCFAYMPTSYKGTYTIPDGIKQIVGSAFGNCIGLTSVTIPNSVTTIGDRTFYGCTNLTSITIPNSVTTIGYEAFYNVANVVYNGTATGSPWMAKCVNGYVDGYLIYSDATKTTLCGCSAAASGKITIPNSVTTIGKCVFCDCSSLTSVTIPNSVTEIGDSAFAGCRSLQSVVIPNFVTKVGNYAFSYCRGLTSITIGDAVTTLGEYAFQYCSGLTSVTIPNSVTTIGNSAFDNCSGLTSVTIGVSVTRIESWAFSDCDNIKVVTWNAKDCYAYEPFGPQIEIFIFGDSVEVIPSNLCKNMTKLTTLTIPKSVTQIESYVFAGCTGLNSITCFATVPPSCWNSPFEQVSLSIPVYVPALSLAAYKQAYPWKKFTNLQANPNDTAVVTCNVVNGIQLGAGTYIKGNKCTLRVTPNCGYSFTQWNDGNTDNPRSFVVIQDTTFTAQIDTAKFGQCGDNLYWNLMGDTLIISGTGAMYDYTESQHAEWWLSVGIISKLILQDGITHIGDSAFVDCNGIETLSLPNSVETIGKYTFANCPYLTDVVIGANVREIGCNAFAGDFRLENITCYAPITPNVCSTTFSGINKFYVYLYVLESAQRKYQVDPNWAGFNLHLIGAEEKPITGDEVTIDPSADNVTITWPANDNAAEYKLVITKDGIVFCTLTFNAQGQLTGIAFAPNRAGSRMLDAAVMTANGWQFTVTGLDQASKYGYTIDALNASKQSIKHYEGEFATDGYTSLEWVTSDKIQSVNKMLLDGHLYILRGSNLYTATGARVK